MPKKIALTPSQLQDPHIIKALKFRDVDVTVKL